MALDQDALRLAKAIRQVESGGDYNARGGSGEFGAYQFMPDTWKGWSKQYLGDENAIPNKINQNKVAYSKVKELKDQGYKANQIASIWNSGKPDYQGKVGTNKYGVQYDVPAYVSKIGSAYKSLKPQVVEASVGQPQQQEQSLFQSVPQETRDSRIEQGLPVSTEARFERTGKATPSFGGGLVRGALNVPAKLLATATSGFREQVEGEGPIQARPMQSNYLGEVKPLQTALARNVDKGVEKAKQGDRLGAVADVYKGAGLSTLAGAGTALEAGSYAVGAKPFTAGVSELTKPVLGQLAKQTAKTEALAGGVGGFGSALEQNITEGVPFGKAVGNVALSTGIGTATGAVAGPVFATAGRVLGTTGRLFTESGRAKVSSEAVDKSVNSMKDLFQTQSGRRYVDNVEIRKGDEPFRLIVESGALKRADIKDNKVVTTNGVKVLQKGQDEFENLLQEALDPVVEPRLVGVRDVAERVIKNIDESQYTAKTKQNLKKQVIDDLKAIVEEQGADTLNLNRWNEIKRTFWKEAFPENKAVTDIDALSRNRKYLTGRAIMQAIEDFAENPDIRELNSVIGTYAEAKKVLNQLSKQTLKKGQLGRYVLQGIGTGVGTSAGGPLGGLVGAMGGDIVTNILQKLSVNSPLRSAMIKYIQKYRPDLTDKLNTFIKTQRSAVDNAKALRQAPTVTPRADTSGAVSQDIARKSLFDLGVNPDGIKRNLPAVIKGEKPRNVKPIILPKG